MLRRRIVDWLCAAARLLSFLCEALCPQTFGPFGHRAGVGLIFLPGLRAVAGLLSFSFECCLGASFRVLIVEHHELLWGKQGK